MKPDGGPGWLFLVVFGAVVWTLAMVFIIGTWQLLDHDLGVRRSSTGALIATGVVTGVFVAGAIAAGQRRRRRGLGPRKTPVLDRIVESMAAGLVVTLAVRGLLEPQPSAEFAILAGWGVTVAALIVLTVLARTRGRRR